MNTYQKYRKVTPWQGGLAGAACGALVAGPWGGAGKPRGGTLTTKVNSSRGDDIYIYI